MDSLPRESDQALLPDYEDDRTGDGLLAEETAQITPDGAGPADLDSLGIYGRDISRNATGGPPCCDAARRSAGRLCFRCLAPGAPGAGRCVLVLAHLRLVVALARRYRHLNLPLEDLIQEGNLGLMTAVRRYDPRKHGRFPTHAARYIRQAICQALSQARTIRIPQRPLALRRCAARVGAELEQRYRNEECRGRPRHEHDLEDDAREIGVTSEELRETVRLVPEVVSLDAPAGPARRSLTDGLRDNRSLDPGHVAAGSEERRRLREAVANLPARLRRIMEMRYGLDGGEGATLAEVGRALALTPPRIHQLHGTALRMLRGDRRLQNAFR